MRLLEMIPWCMAVEGGQDKEVPVESHPMSRPQPGPAQRQVGRQSEETPLGHQNTCVREYTTESVSLEEYQVALAIVLFLVHNI